MKPKISIIELFSGIGAQIKGLKNTNLFEVESKGTSDLDKEVIVSYAAIHNGLTNDLINTYDNYPTKEEMIKELTEKRIGYDFKKDKGYNWEKLAKRSDKTKGIEKYWLANHLSKNLGDISLVKSLPYCDLLTYSFPCTNLSIEGKQEGLKWTCQDCGESYDPSSIDVNNRYNCPYCHSDNIKSTSSGLLYEVERLLLIAKQNNSLPKYLLMENVDALVSKKNIDSFQDWINRLDSLGYNTYYQVINAKYAGVPQNRKRIFCISILKEIDTKNFTFPLPFDNGMRFKDIAEKEQDILDKYFLSDKVQKRFQCIDETMSKNIIGTTKPEYRTIGQKDLVYNENGIMGTLIATDYKQPKQIYVSNNETFKCIHSGDLCSEKYKRMHEISRRIYNEEGIIPAITCFNGGNTETKIERNNFKVVRKITPKECHRLMGFNDIDYNSCKAVGMSDSQGYKQAGNSIVVNVISLLIEHLYKAEYNENYVCLDQQM